MKNYFLVVTMTLFAAQAAAQASLLNQAKQAKTVCKVEKLKAVIVIQPKSYAETKDSVFSKSRMGKVDIFLMAKGYKKDYLNQLVKYTRFETRLGTEFHTYVKVGQTLQLSLRDMWIAYQRPDGLTRNLRGSLRDLKTNTRYELTKCRSL